MSECIFCEIVAGRIPSPHCLDTGTAVVIRDIAPAAPRHYLVLSRKHVASLNEADPETVAGLFAAARTWARQEGFDLEGYRAVINVLERGGQTVGHLHLHLLAGRDMTWPPG
jgi:histidine triad (HIT) family protein